MFFPSMLHVLYGLRTCQIPTVLKWYQNQLRVTTACSTSHAVFELEHSTFVQPCYRHKLSLGLHSQCVYRCWWAALLDISRTMFLRWRLVLGAPDYER